MANPYKPAPIVGEEGGAQFNIGLSTAIEIRKLLNECNQFSRMGLFVDWYNTLLALEREVTPEMKPGDDDTLKEIRPDLIKKMGASEGNASSQSKNSAFDVLHKFEVALRIVIKKRGLGMPDKDDDEGL